jgi:hypothetical protein
MNNPPLAAWLFVGKEIYITDRASSRLPIEEPSNQVAVSFVGKEIYITGGALRRLPIGATLR